MGRLGKVSIIKAKYTKNIFGSHFPTEHNGVTDYFLIKKKLLRMVLVRL